MRNLITLRNIDVGFSLGINLLSNINLNIKEKDFLLITGSNGSGKSTLLKLFYMKVLPTKGEFFIFNNLISKDKKKEIIKLRKKLGVILQNNFLIPYLSVAQNIQLSIQIQINENIRMYDRVNEIIDWVGLKGLGEKKIFDLSEGQKQKVIIARALVTKPKILIADEPMNNLDKETKDKLYFLFQQINNLGTTIIMTTKNISVHEKIKKCRFFFKKQKSLIEQ